MGEKKGALREKTSPEGLGKQPMSLLAELCPAGHLWSRENVYSWFTVVTACMVTTSTAITSDFPSLLKGNDPTNL